LQPTFVTEQRVSAPLRHLRTLAILSALGCQPLTAAPACNIAQVGQLAVTMHGTMPIVHALINGRDAAFMADSGAYYNMLTPAAAAEYGLPQQMARIGYWVSGVGGSTAPMVATVKEFTIMGGKFPNVPFLVAGNDLGPAVGVIGQNLFHVFDVEYDLANGAIRIMRPGTECKSIGLAYWAQSAPASQIDITLSDPENPHTIGDAYLNGTKIKVMFDTGAGASLLSLEAARKAGITPTSPGVVPLGAASGIGQHYVQTWVAPFQSFKIGDEEIRDIKLRIGNLSGFSNGTEMLLGADFFLSHRVYVANSRSKLYFTYNGGPVFNLGGGPQDAKAPNESIAVASGGSVAGSGEPTDAAAFSRRAALATARREYASAVADLNRACGMAPDNPDYLYQRGMALWGNQQSDLALADFNAALKLKPDDVPALLARAHLRVKSDVAAATADLEAADRLLAKEAVEHLDIADVYEQADLLPAAVAQFSMWIDTHERTDVRMPNVLNSRCWTRALWGQELDAALADCNGALKLQAENPTFLDSRGLVYLRLGNYDKSIADYSAALAREPKIAWSRYGRGISRLRKGLTMEGQADIAAATELSPKIAETAGKYGVSP
jgi:predicted aspartyl protease/tetratricopeptide (TPR) repeat protein